ncbi:excalibur calcium-binding domain-containing protein [Bacillus badius]|uniref:Excalibur calcium-binding domain-containing protein n=1 Tax=Bacillus badius TaxID=1455 RepID=A0ABR5AP41_BACBA|nr:excalibur calcium-binding domain-containing protein [Bacillus badius]KIL73734.1 hypothetical protein SD77_3011 [Bacillus badius]MED4715250.1 excalibur calcium-binding domain-containing protein [Bacillus badius]
MSEKKESEAVLTKRYIREKHPEAWMIEYASIGEKLNTSEFGAFTRDKLITYKLVDKQILVRTGEIFWPKEKHGEVDHFALKSIFSIDGVKFVTGNNGKEVQRFLEDEKKDSFTKIPRIFYQKILGFRSNKRWKQITAVVGYLLVLFLIIGFFNGNDNEERKIVKKEEEKQDVVNKKEEVAKPVVKQKDIDETEKEETSNKPIVLKDDKSTTISETEDEQIEEPAEDLETQQENVYYKNCAAVRAAGAAPIYRGDPGYGSHLDREGDGVACEQ